MLCVCRAVNRPRRQLLRAEHAAVVQPPAHHSPLRGEGLVQGLERQGVVRRVAGVAGAACGKMETQCAVLNTDSVCVSRQGRLTTTSEHSNTKGRLEQVLGNWDESDEGGGL